MPMPMGRVELVQFNCAFYMRNSWEYRLLELRNSMWRVLILGLYVFVCCSAYRTPQCRAKRGGFKDARPEDLLDPVLKVLVTVYSPFLSFNLDAITPSPLTVVKRTTSSPCEYIPHCLWFKENPGTRIYKSRESLANSHPLSRFKSHWLHPIAWLGSIPMGSYGTLRWPWGHLEG